MSNDSLQKVFEKFDRFDREAYADWLWRGLRSFYMSSFADRASAFDHFGPLIRQQESVFEGLACVYEDYVPESRQLLFRQAIGDVLREQANNQDAPFPVFQDLIYLIGRIRASESLNALSPTVGTGRIGKWHPEILYETFAVLRLLAPSAHAYEAASTLVDCANFDEGYLFEAVKVLIECEPPQTATILLNFVSRMTQLRQSAYRLGGDEWVAFCEATDGLVQHILRFAPKSWIADFWNKAEHSPEQKWIFNLFFNNEIAKICFVRDEPAIEYSGVQIPLNPSTKDYWTRRQISTSLRVREVRQWANTLNDKVNKSGQIETDAETPPLSLLIGSKVDRFIPNRHQDQYRYN